MHGTAEAKTDMLETLYLYVVRATAKINRQAVGLSGTRPLAVVVPLPSGKRDPIRKPLATALNEMCLA